MTILETEILISK